MEKSIMNMSEEELSKRFTEQYRGTPVTKGGMYDVLSLILDEIVEGIKGLRMLDFDEMEYNWKSGDIVWIEYRRQGICRLRLTTKAQSDEPMAPCVIDGVLVTICYAGDCIESTVTAIWKYFGRPDPIPADKKERLTSLYRCPANQAVDTPEKLEEELKDLLEYWPKMKDDPKVKRLFE